MGRIDSWGGVEGEAVPYLTEAWIKVDPQLKTGEIRLTMAKWSAIAKWSCDITTTSLSDVPLWS